MTRACASVVEARGSFSRGFLDAGSPASPFASAAASCGAFLAARSASLRAASCCLACSSSVTGSARRTPPRAPQPPPLAILAPPPTRRGLLAAGGAGIGIKLRVQIVHRLFCLAPALLQGRMPPERRRPRRGAADEPLPRAREDLMANARALAFPVAASRKTVGRHPGATNPALK